MSIQRELRRMADMKERPTFLRLTADRIDELEAENKRLAARVNELAEFINDSGRCTCWGDIPNTEPEA